MQAPAKDLESQNLIRSRFPEKRKGSRKSLPIFEGAKVVREQVISDLRDRARVRGKQKTWISELSDNQLYELFLRLRNQETAKSIARHIQRAWGVNPQSSTHSISQGILKFKRRIAHLLLPPPPEKPGLPAQNSLDEVQELEGPEGVERIAQLQLDRIQRMMAEEHETGVRHNTMSREIQALTTLMKALKQAKEWDLVHQGNDPLKRRKYERMEKRFTSIMDDTISQGGDRLLEATEKFLQLAEEQALAMEVGPDGEFQLAKSD